jgi:hypothetical protein
MTNDLAQIEPRAIEGQVVSRPSPGALAQTDQQRAIAEVQAAMMIARANPRDQKEAIDRILIACQRQRLAEAAVYSYSRGGSEISGPSIRLAEALAQNWGNIQFGIREIEQRGGESTVQAFAWDVETNVKREMVFTVPHVRHTKRGSYKLDDPRDIYEMVANNGARRLRSCILAVIPGDVVDMAVEQCEVTMRAKADTSPEAIQKMLAAFEGLGVTQQQIEARIQRRLDAIQPAQVVALKKIYASLRDGMSQPVDWFEPLQIEAGDEKPTKGNAGAKAALKTAVGRKQQQQQFTDESGDTIDSATGEVVDEAGKHDEPEQNGEDERDEADQSAEVNDLFVGDAQNPMTEVAEELIEAMSAASNVAALKALYDGAQLDIAGMPDDTATACEQAYDRNLKRLGTSRAKVAAALTRAKAEAEPAK